MQVSIAELAFLAGGVLAGAITVWLILKGKLAGSEAGGRAAGEVERTSLAEQLKAASARLAEFEEWRRESGRVAEQLHKEVSGWREASARLESDLAARQSRQIEIEGSHRQLSIERDDLLKAQAGLQARVAELTTTVENERTQTEEKLALLQEAREQLSNQFKALANEILDEKSKKFTDQNQTNLDQLLRPLKQQLTDFKTKVEEVYVNEGKDRSALAEQVKMLTQLNNTLSLDTQNLTLALKGDRKAQGTWGEIILDEVLEKAGLIRGTHYVRQGGVVGVDGQGQSIPDVVIKLPGERYLVVDSKMTLPDYRAFASADDDSGRAAALKRHLGSIRAHIKGLSEKQYQSLYDLKSLDCVVMFVPLEPAFTVAVTHDNELFQHAWEKNVLLVSPSTLLFVVRTVAYLWRQEGLSRNAKDISNRGAELYDKLVGFVTDLDKVGERIGQAQNSYDAARNKLSQGSGNLIRQAQKLKSLGVKPAKSLPAEWIERAGEDASAIADDQPK